jgi:hypothetical protein
MISAIVPVVIWAVAEAVLAIAAGIQGSSMAPPLRWPHDRQFLVSIAACGALTAAGWFMLYKRKVLKSSTARVATGLGASFVLLVFACSGLLVAARETRIQSVDLPNGNRLHLWSETEWAEPFSCVYYCIEGPEGIVVSPKYLTNDEEGGFTISTDSQRDETTFLGNSTHERWIIEHTKRFAIDLERRRP